MFKKAMAAGLVLLILCLAACGKESTPAEPTESQSSVPTSAPTEAPDADDDTGGEQATLIEQVEAMGPANKHDALSLAYILFGQKVTETTEAMEAAGLAEEEVFQSYLVDWSRLATENVMDLLSLYADRGTVK